MNLLLRPISRPPSGGRPKVDRPWLHADELDDEDIIVLITAVADR